MYFLFSLALLSVSRSKRLISVLTARRLRSKAFFSEINTQCFIKEHRWGWRQRKFESFCSHRTKHGSWISVSVTFRLWWLNRLEADILTTGLQICYSLFIQLLKVHELLREREKTCFAKYQLHSFESQLLVWKSTISIESISKSPLVLTSWNPGFSSFFQLIQADLSCAYNFKNLVCWMTRLLNETRVSGVAKQLRTFRT